MDAANGHILRHVRGFYGSWRNSIVTVTHKLPARQILNNDKTGRLYPCLICTNASTLNLQHCHNINNPLGNLNSGPSGLWAKLIRSASLQLVFDAAISKLLWRLVSRCFYMSICVFYTIRLKWLVQFECVVMWQTFIDSRQGNVFKYYVGCL